MVENTTHREESVDFTDLDPVLEALSYPLSTDTLVQRHGDHAIERTNADPISVEEVFAGTGEETFDSAEDVRQGILNLLPRETVGRQRYSDRGGSGPQDAPDSPGQDEESF